MRTLSGVLDADMIIGLAKGAVFDLLRSLYAPLYIPSAVAREVIAGGQGRPGEPELTAALRIWITEVIPDPHLIQQFSVTLSPADREVLAVAREKAADHVLTNDAALRREAARSQLSTLQTPHIVVLFKDQGLIMHVKPVLDRMRQNSFGIDDQSYETALRAAGEWPPPQP